MTVAPGWAVVVHGEKIDMDDLRNHLIAPFDLWVEDFSENGETMLLLRSSDWDALTDARAVFEDAVRILAQAHGAALLTDPDALPCTVGGVRKFNAQGPSDQFLIAEIARFKTKWPRVSRPAPIMSANQETPLQRLLASAKANDVHAELLLHLGRADNWFDLYKSIELAQRLNGGERKSEALIGADASMWENVRRTANHYRHAPNPKKYPLPLSPPTLPDARLFVLRVVSTLL